MTGGGNVGIGTTEPGYLLSLKNIKTGHTDDTLLDVYSQTSGVYGGTSRIGIRADSSFYLEQNSGAAGEGLRAGSTYFDSNLVNSVTGGVYGAINFYTDATLRMKIHPAGHMLPGATGTQDLGSDTLRWRTVYTSDLALKNDKGDWTIVEGEEDLFLYNNLKKKVYKFNLTEVDPSMATPKNI